MERLHHHQVGVAGRGFGNARRLGRVGGERLLAQHVLARFQRGDGPFGVKPVGKRVVDGVDFGVLEQGPVALGDAVDSVLSGERRGPLAIACSDCDHPGVFDPAGRPDDGGWGDAGRAEHPDADNHQRGVLGDI